MLHCRAKSNRNNYYVSVKYPHILIDMFELRSQLMVNDSKTHQVSTVLCHHQIEIILWVLKAVFETESDPCHGPPASRLSSPS